MRDRSDNVYTEILIIAEEHHVRINSHSKETTP